MKTKICTKCKKRKNKKYFSKSNRDIDKLADWCKKCVKNYNHQNKKSIQSYKQKYHIKMHTKSRWKILFKQIKCRCTNATHSSYKYYGGKGIKCLITEEELKRLWFRDKAYLMKKPSIHRKNSNKNYTYKNCQFIELSENVRKTQSKSVYQYKLNGQFIKEWSSSKEASEHCKICRTSISQCLKKKYKTAGGYIWRNYKYTKKEFT